VATERQIAANRANASKSTGPRSAAGKKRAADNSFRHGLTLRYSDAKLTRQLDIRARLMVGETDDNVTLELARTVAEAELEIARVRQVKATLIEPEPETGDLQPAKHFRSSAADTLWFIEMQELMGSRRSRKPSKAIPFDPADTMLSEPQRMVFEELVKLMHYECRAVARRDRAVKAMMLRRTPAQLN
jgi:hypothetical protein